MVWQHLIKLNLDYIDTHQPSDTALSIPHARTHSSCPFFYERSGLLLAPHSSSVPFISVPQPIRRMHTTGNSVEIRSLEQLPVSKLPKGYATLPHLLQKPSNSTISDDLALSIQHYKAQHKLA